MIERELVATGVDDKESLRKLLRKRACEYLIAYLVKKIGNYGGDTGDQSHSRYGTISTAARVVILTYHFRGTDLSGFAR